MARVNFIKENEVTGQAKDAFEAHLERKNLTNMKKALLQDYATYDVYMGWYKSWERLVEIIGERAATIYAHAISTTNSCLLCSLFFISDIKALGLDPKNLVLKEQEQMLAELGTQIVKNPNGVTDELFLNLKSFYSDSEIVAIVGFAGQMIATNNFNAVLKIDVDERLLPIKEEFEPVTWRDHIQ